MMWERLRMCDRNFLVSKTHSRGVAHTRMAKESKSPLLCLGIEGSANKIGVGIVREDGEILSNPRHT